MSELINAATAAREFRRQLLTTVSATALIVSISCARAADGDTDRPTVWIELGGQMEGMSGQGEAFAPPFIAANSTSSVFSPVSPIDAQKLPFSFGGEGAITFQPENSDWMVLASVRYGRSSGGAHINQQTKGHRVLEVAGSYYNGAEHKVSYYVTPADFKFAQTNATHSQSHAIVDFQVGRDVGLGMFGSNSTSVFGFGVRFAQFTSKASVVMHAAPDLKTFNVFAAYPSFFPASYYFPTQRFHAYDFSAHSTRSFHGVGPSISWNGSAPVIGNRQQAEIDVDWGVNAAILFGRQKASGSHQTSGRYHKYYGFKSPYQHSAHFTRARAVTVPNIGGFAGLSFRYAAAKVSFGYRADFFFGAMDTGIDTAQKPATGFYGPFATISIGLGG